MARKYLVAAWDTGNWSEVSAELSPEQIEEVIGRYIAWTEGLRSKGRLIASHKLRDGEGRVVRGNGAKMRVMDGPHAESKEVLGGFWLIEAESYDEALKLVADCPHLEHGTLEVREIEETPA